MPCEISAVFRTLDVICDGIGFAFPSGHEQIAPGVDCRLGARPVGARIGPHPTLRSLAIRMVAVAVLFSMPAMARAQQQEPAPPPATVDPRDWPIAARVWWS